MKPCIQNKMNLKQIGMIEGQLMFTQNMVRCVRNCYAEGLDEVGVFKPDVRYKRNFEQIEQDAKDKQLNIWAH